MVEAPMNPIDDDAVLREVWNTQDIEAKTELHDGQIERVNKLKTLGDIFNNKLLASHLDDFMVLQKSRNRKSMEEFCAAMKAKREDFVNQGRGFFGGMMG